MWFSLKTISLSIARFLSYWTIDIHHTRFPHVHATPDNAINIQPAPQPVLENVHLQPETFIHEPDTPGPENSTTTYDNPDP